uniref:Putative LOC100891476 [Strongylocentrotus purpuratus] n=1 Tax=Lepeophtheirus salmonis TaxID=72036 RepID=A0A0K2USX8_LEPSM
MVRTLWFPSKDHSKYRTIFKHHLFKKLNHLMGCQHFKTTAYHPTVNGMLERIYSNQKASLGAFASNWIEYLHRASVIHSKKTLVTPTCLWHILTSSSTILGRYDYGHLLLLSQAWQVVDRLPCNL